MKLLNLYRERRRYEVRTLDGYKPEYEITHNAFSAEMYLSLTREIEILSQTIGGRSKTAIRKECRQRGIPIPNFSREALPSTTTNPLY